MFSTTQIEVAQTLVPTMRDSGYKYYIAYTNTKTGNYTFNEPDLYFIFSKDKIEASSGYEYAVPEGSVQYACRSGNYSTSSSGVNTERYVFSPYSGNLIIEPYEHIYSNAVYGESSVVMPDINFRGAGEEYEKTNSLGLVVTAVLLFIVFCSFFKR